MKRFSCVFLSILLLLLLLSGCGSSGAATDSLKKEEVSVMESTTASKPQAEMDYGYTYNDSLSAPMEKVEMEDAATEAGNGGNPTLSNAKLIYSADISLQTTEFDAAVSKLETLVTGLGGYFERSSVDNYSNYRYGSYTVRVPAEAFHSFCSQVGALCKVN